MTLPEQIKHLRSQGYSYKKIAAAIPCSRSTVNYHLTEGAKTKAVARLRNRRHITNRRLKESHGCKCAVCGYNKCLEALEFDHINPKTKQFKLSVVRDKWEKAEAEASNCLLLCCRCHRERHAGLLDIGAYLAPDL